MAGELILAVDDTPRNVRLLEAVLLPRGYRVTAGRTWGQPTLFFSPANRTDQLVNAFAQDQISFAEDRVRLIQELKRQDIHAAFHYVSLHLSPMGARFGSRQGDCPVAERASACLLRLPFYTDLSAAEQDRVIAAVTRFTACG